jgi:hypothetical protein
MSADRSLAGLERVAPLLAAVWGQPLQVGPAQTLLGYTPYAGARSPLPSSAARLTLGADQVWIPAPFQPARPEEGLAPLFRQAGRVYVLPTIRLFEHAAGRTRHLPAPRYLSHADWLYEAWTQWPFPLVRPGSLEPVPAHERAVPQTCTLLEVLGKELAESSQRLSFLARMIAFALFGARQTEYLPLPASRLLVIPRRPQWLRPVVASPLGEAVARALVLTARRHTPPSGHGTDGVPRLPRPLGGYHIRPTDPRDWGLDPVHTPESEDIRLIGRLGVGVGIRDGKLAVPAGVAVPLSPSSARLPFAGYNDPRRLLLAANMQVQAVPLPAGEQPLVHNGTPGDDPPGVNLRVAYLAWHGWNHEDAWVVSASAARRLHARAERIQVVAVRAVELPPQLLVEAGQPVRRGQLLVRRRVAPALLAPALEQLVHLESLDELVPLEPEPDDRARCDGTVAAIETWDLRRGEGFPPDWHVPADLPGRYRLVLRVHLRRDLPLAVGDKLANRHGHKGIVGAILPDEQMPCWQGEPLDALIDPISVLNRSNWGQLYESVAGAVARQEGTRWPAPARPATAVLEQARSLLGLTAHGQAEIQPPRASAGDRPVLALAGVQFVLRLPHHAVDKIAADPAAAGPDGHRVRSRAQRFGEMEHWACLAHGLERVLRQPRQLAPAAVRLQRLLAQAGFDLQLAGPGVTLRRLALDGSPPADYRCLRSGDRSLPELFDDLETVATGQPAALVFEPPVPLVTLPRSRRAGDVGWVPILPAEDRPPCPGPDGSLFDHELTVGLRAVVRAAHEQRRSRADPRRGLRLRKALAALLRRAYTLAVGWCGAGPASSKGSVLRREVLGRRVSHSGRATVSPTGPWEFGLDTIGLPVALARAVLGRAAADEAALEEAGSRCWVWIKRDPLLHRWGLLPVRFRLVPGQTIRLPPALLGPMGADFDGDTVAVFALPDFQGPVAASRPSAIACQDVLGVPLFLAGKQYVWGLARLMQDRSLKAALSQALREAGAPPWPDDPSLTSARQALEQWVGTAGTDPQRDGRWWGLVEEHALRGLALDPGMGLGLFPWEQLTGLEVIAQGAAKGDLYTPAQAPALTRLLAGQSLEIYRQADPSGGDLIAEVMVVAKASVGYFGGVFRRLLLSVRQVDPGFLRHGQALTEQLTQQVLSIKAGQRPLSFAEFQPLLRGLLEGTAADLPEALAHLKPLWTELRRRLAADGSGACPDWLQWLRLPHELARLVDEAAAGCLHLPLDDPRGQLFLATSRTEEAPGFSHG